MSLTGAFWVNSTAMRTQSAALGAIAENIANVNTGGYRRKDIGFATLLGHYDGHLSKDNGVKLATIRHAEEGGKIVATRNALDGAFTNRGFFVLADDAGGAPTAYTRDGGFRLLASTGGGANLVSKSGLYLMGWPVSPTGTVAQTLQVIDLPPKGSPIAATPTTAIDIVDNLPATATLGASFTSTVTVYDSAGTPQDVILQFTRAGTNSWTVSASGPGGVVSGGPFALQFDTQGQPTGTTGIAIAATWAGGGTSALAIDLSGMQQLGDAFVPRGNTQNGIPAGALESVEFVDDGFLVAHYSNGLARRLYQVPAAVFANPGALSERDGNIYRESDSSGAASYVDPASSGRARFIAQAVELANVDVAEEFTKMIVTQRAYSSAATAFRTVDEMTETARDLKR